MKNELAIFGGPKTRERPFPSRKLFGRDSFNSIAELFSYYEQRDQDFGSDGYFEKRYTDLFIELMGTQGYCDAVCSGTAGLYIAIASLNLRKGSSVLVSPITDPGTLSAIILNGLTPKVLDSSPHSYNTSINELTTRYSSDVSAVMLVHAGGKPVLSISEIANFCQQKNIALIEDCSQAHGALVSNRKIGTFGDVAVFSTMFSKNHSTGGTGGVVFTKSEELYHKIRMHGDRGKPFHQQEFNPKDPSTFLFPALNLPLGEIGSAIGYQTLELLRETRKKRVELLLTLNELLAKESKICKLDPCDESCSPFFWTIHLLTEKINCSKIEFANALIAEGIPVNPHYGYLITSWPWLAPYLADKFIPRNALSVINASFNFLFHEKFTTEDIRDVASAILKVEKFYSKP